MVRDHLLAYCILWELHHVWTWNPIINWRILHPPLECRCQMAQWSYRWLTSMHRNLGRLFSNLYCPCWGDSPLVEPTEPDLTPHYPYLTVSLLKKKSGFEFHVIPVYRYNNTFAGPIVTSQVFFWFPSLWLFERRELRRIWEWWHKTLCSHCRSQLWLPHTTIGQSFQHCNILFYH